MDVIDIASSSSEDEEEEAFCSDVNPSRFSIENIKNSGTNGKFIIMNSPLDPCMNRIWRCSFPGCNYQSKSERSVSRHQKVCHIETHYECPLCKKFVTADVEEYSRHIIQHHDTEVRDGTEKEETEDEADSAIDENSGLDTEKSDGNSSEENSPDQPEAKVYEAVNKSRTRACEKSRSKIQHDDTEVTDGNENKETEKEADSAVVEESSGLDTEKSDGSSREEKQPEKVGTEVGKAVKVSQRKRSVKFSKGEKIWKCSSCCYTTQENRCVKAHIRMHSDEKAMLCTEAGCGYLSNRISNMKCHLAHVHGYAHSDITEIFNKVKTPATNPEAMETSADSCDQSEVPALVSLDSANFSNSYASQDTTTEIIAVEADACIDSGTENLTATNFEVICIEVVDTDSVSGVQMKTGSESNPLELDSEIGRNQPSENPKFTCDRKNHLQRAYPRRKSRLVRRRKLQLKIKKMKKSKTFKVPKTGGAVDANFFSKDGKSSQEGDEELMPKLESSASDVLENIFSNKNHLPSPPPPVLKCIGSVKKLPSVASDQSAEINETTVIAHEDPYRCSECGFHASSTTALRNHCRTHGPQYSKSIPIQIFQSLYSCQYCEHTDTTLTAVDIHMRRVHPEKKAYSCSYPSCTYSTKYRSNFQKHIIKSHKRKLKMSAKRKPKMSVKRKPVAVAIEPKHSIRNRHPKHSTSSQTSFSENITKSEPRILMRTSKVAVVGKETEAHSKCSFADCNFRTKYRCNLYAHVRAVHLGKKRINNRSKRPKIQAQPTTPQSSVDSSNKEAEDCLYCSYSAKLGGYLRVHLQPCPVHNKKMKQVQDQVPCSSSSGAEELSEAEQENTPNSESSKDPPSEPEAPLSEFGCKFCDFAAETPVAAAEHDMKHRRAVVVLKRL